VVLAGGEGRRLSGLVRALHKSEIPKQFAILNGTRTMLQKTLDRIAPAIPGERTVIVVDEAWIPVARQQIERDHGGVEFLSQSRNLETALGILLAIAWIRKRDSSARIVILPSDHYIPRPEPFLDGISNAASFISLQPEYLTLLGVPAVSAETEYGWIRAGGVLPPESLKIRRIVQFIEKPDPATARILFFNGCLWNTMVCVGTSQTYWETARRFLPAVVAAFEEHYENAAPREEPDAARRVYEVCDPANFSTQVLQCAGDLAVAPVVGSGWSDWGSPRRVFESLAGSREGELLRWCALGDDIAFT
jgi:mannose-1-phosphate guanylyltransferase